MRPCLKIPKTSRHLRYSTRHPPEYTFPVDPGKSPVTFTRHTRVRRSQSIFYHYARFLEQDTRPAIISWPYCTMYTARK